MLLLFTVEVPKYSQKAFAIEHIVVTILQKNKRINSFVCLFYLTDQYDLSSELFTSLLHRHVPIANDHNFEGFFDPKYKLPCCILKWFIIPWLYGLYVCCHQLHLFVCPAVCPPVSIIVVISQKLFHM